MYKHILIPTDGSELAGKAVTHGIALAKTLGARVTALTVRPLFDLPTLYLTAEQPSMQLADEMEKFRQRSKEQAEKMLNAVGAAAGAAGVTANVVSVEHQQPYEAIIETAKEAGCDLICIASHGRGGASALILGSVTSKVLTHSTIPVLVYR